MSGDETFMAVCLAPDPEAQVRGLSDKRLAGLADFLTGRAGSEPVLYLGALVVGEMARRFRRMIKGGQA